MSKTRCYLLLLLVLVAGGCTSSTAPEAEVILGRWATEREALSPSGSVQYHLVLGRDQRFSSETRMYGVYAKQAPAALSAFLRHEGHFHVEGTNIVFQPETRISWDSFYGVAEPTVEKLSSSHTLYDGATFEVRQNRRLTLHYLTYPLDAPVPTQKTFWRVKP